MAVIRCEHGHFFDNEKFDNCPHCEAPPKVGRLHNDDLTQYKTTPSQVFSSQMQIQLSNVVGDEDKTVRLYQESIGIDPTVAWLVCTEGPERGRSYPLHVGRNFIGRALTMDISMTDDEMVSRENHCSIVFDPNSIQYFLARGNGAIVLVNQEPVSKSIRLQGDELIAIGSSLFVFIPFCKEGRLW